MELTGVRVTRKRMAEEGDQKLVEETVDLMTIIQQTAQTASDAAAQKVVDAARNAPCAHGAAASGVVDGPDGPLTAPAERAGLSSTRESSVEVPAAACARAAPEALEASLRTLCLHTTSIGDLPGPQLNHE